MIKTSFGSIVRAVGFVFAVAVVTCLTIMGTANAVVPPPDPKSGSVGVEGTITSPPPTQAATIVAPANGSTFDDLPVTVTGSCPKDILVKLFSNNIFVGSVTCPNGSYSIKISLFSGRNDLVARVFDALDQQGPDSNVVTVTYNDAKFAQFGSHVLITSQYARRAADPGAELDWPIIVSGGIGPYAISVDWGDGTTSELHSEPFAGTFTYKHVYKIAGIYKVTFSAVDSNDTSAYLQVIAVATGTAGTTTNGSGSTNGSGNNDPNANKTVVTQTKVLWQPTAALVFLAIATFWLGRRFELSSLRKKIEKEYQ
jgi:hypothetical protein